MKDRKNFSKTVFLSYTSGVEFQFVRFLLYMVYLLTSTHQISHLFPFIFSCGTYFCLLKVLVLDVKGVNCFVYLILLVWWWYFSLRCQDLKKKILLGFCVFSYLLKFLLFWCWWWFSAMVWGLLL